MPPIFVKLCPVFAEWDANVQRRPNFRHNLSNCHRGQIILTYLRLGLASSSAYAGGLDGSGTQ